MSIVKEVQELMQSVFFSSLNKFTKEIHLKMGEDYTKEQSFPNIQGKNMIPKIILLPPY